MQKYVDLLNTKYKLRNHKYEMQCEKVTLRICVPHVKRDRFGNVEIT